MTKTDETPVDELAEQDADNYHDGHWRCGRADGCGQPAGWGTDHVGYGACKLHGGNAGAPEGNNNAVTVAAWSEDYVTDFMRDDEAERIKDLSELLEDPTSAQEVAARAASLAMEQFRRTGNDHFLRRFESICDKANLFPDDESTVNVGLEDLYDEGGQ